MPLFVAFALGIVITLVYSAATSDWTVLSAWAMTSAFGSAGGALFLVMGAAFQNSIGERKNFRWRLVLYAWVFALRWLLLGAALFVAAFNTDIFSLPTTAAAVVLPPLVYMGAVFGYTLAHRTK